MNRNRTLAALAAAVLTAAAGAAPTSPAVSGQPRPERAAAQAEPDLGSGRGKYRVLLHKLHLPQDLQSYGSFRDWGMWNGTAYYDFNNLSPGYWVYHYPHWYIWRDCVKPEMQLPAVGPGQPGQPVPVFPPPDGRFVPDGNGRLVPPGVRKP